MNDAHSVKRSAALFLCVVLLLCTALPQNVSAADNSQKINVIINGETQEFETEPVIIDGTTFVPMREIFEALGADVEWNNARREASATSGNVELVLKIGSRTAINGQKVDTLLQAPYISDGYTMMPLRYIGESLGYDVDWNQSSGTVTIDSNETANGDQTSDESDGRLLTYDNAISRAIAKSMNVKQAKLSLDMADRQNEEFDWLYSNVDSFAVWQNRKDLTIYKNWYEKQIIVTEEQTAYSITSSMDQISLKQAEIQRKQENMDFLQKKTDRAKLLYDVGTGSRKDVLSAQADYDAAAKELAALETELDGLYTAMNSILQYADSDRNIPEFKISYESVADYDIDAAIKTELENDPYIWYVEQNLDSAEFKLQTYQFNAGGKSYNLTSMDVDKVRNDADATKDKLDSTMRSRYNSLIKTEDQISSLENTLDTLNENIDTVRTQLDVGMTTKITLEELLQSKADIEMNLTALKVSHAITKEQLLKPYLVPEYVMTGN